MQKTRPFSIHVVVNDHGLDFFAASGDALYRAVGLEIAFALIEDNQLTGTCRTMVPGNDGRKFLSMSGNLFGIEKGVGPIRVRTIDRAISGSVGIHLQQDAGEVMRVIGIFPAAVHHPAGFLDPGIPVVFLIEADLLHVASIGIDLIERPDIVFSAYAGNRVERSR